MAEVWGNEEEDHGMGVEEDDEEDDILDAGEDDAAPHAPCPSSTLLRRCLADALLPARFVHVVPTRR